MRKVTSVSSLAIASGLALLTPAVAVATSGTTSIGSTISATAWEREISGFTYDDGGTPIGPEGDIEEYVYRIFDGETPVDVQSTAGYVGLTEAEQTQWYEDEGWAPYDFNWVAFYCEADDSPAGVKSDAGIVLNEMIYIAADDRFVDSSRIMSSDYHLSFFEPWNDGSLYEVDNPNPDLASTVGYTVTVNGYGDMIFSTSYADFACPADSTLVYGTIADPEDPTSPATDRELTIPEVLSIDTGSGDVEVASDNVFIGVTGQNYSIAFNAALWGMTQVEGDLADTGLSFDPAALGVIAVGATAVGAVVVARRRRTNS